MPRRGDRAGRREGRRAGRVRRRLDRLVGVVRRRARRPRRVRESGDAVGSYDAATGLWTLFPDGQAARSLPAGASATLVVRVKIAPAAAGKKVTNAASLESLDQKDDNAANNSSKASLDVLQSVSGSVYRDSDRDGARGGGEAGVERTKVELRDHDGAVVATATTGADGSYSFNRVPSGTATGVKVEDRLPKGLTFVSADRPYDSATGVWDVGTLAPGKSAEISIVARATGEGGLVNKAEIAAADQKDVDSTPGNGVASEDDAASATVTVKPAPKPTLSPSPSPSAEPTSPAPANPAPTSTSPTATLTSPAPSPSPTSSPTATMPTPTPSASGPSPSPSSV